MEYLGRWREVFAHSLTHSGHCFGLQSHGPAVTTDCQGMQLGCPGLSQKTALFIKLYRQLQTGALLHPKPGQPAAKVICHSSPLPKPGSLNNMHHLCTSRSRGKIRIENRLVPLSACVCMKYSAPSPGPAACQGCTVRTTGKVTAAPRSTHHSRATARTRRCSEASSIFKLRMRHIQTQLLTAARLVLPQEHQEMGMAAESRSGEERGSGLSLLRVCCGLKAK